MWRSWGCWRRLWAIDADAAPQIYDHEPETVLADASHGNEKDQQELQPRDTKGRIAVGRAGKTPYLQ